MIRIESDGVRTLPSVRGLHADGDEWRLDPSQYRAFTDAVTGLTLPDEPDAADCYRVGNRLEAFVAERKREGEWTDDLPERYPDIESLAEVTALARFFRTCHERCLAENTRCS